MMSKVFFTSDLHFGHTNVITFDKRPFSSVEEMDEELIKRWNKKVGKGDLVYVLGDMIWKSSNNDAENLIRSLNGQIILIKGNHDRFINNAKAKKALAGIKEYDDIVVTLEDGTKRRCILSHYYMPFYNGHLYQTILLHGHSHISKEAEMEQEISKLLTQRGFPNEIYNVGCMHWNYEPVTLDEIIAKKPQPPILTNYDRVRALSVEDMAKGIKCPLEGFDDITDMGFTSMECIDPSGCRECCVDWLKCEAKNINLGDYAQ